MAGRFMRALVKKNRGVVAPGNGDDPKSVGVMKKGQGSGPRGTTTAASTQYETDANHVKVKDAIAAEKEIVRKSRMPRFPRYNR